MDGIILSFQLFSRIPIKKSVDFNSKNIKIALLFLPILGFILGGLTGGVVWLFIGKSPFIAGSLGLITYIFLSGGLHLDGFSDTADGFFSNASPERILEIMKDSLIGSFGTLALITYSLLKFSLYASLKVNPIIYCGLASSIARISSLYVIRKGALARPGGFGAKMKEALAEDNKIYFYFILLAISGIYFWPALVSFCVAMLASHLILKKSTEKISGVTGDVYGATIESNELLCLLTFWAVETWI